MHIGNEKAGRAVKSLFSFRWQPKCFGVKKTKRLQRGIIINLFRYVLLLVVLFLSSESGQSEPSTAKSQAAPQGFRHFALGMSVEQVKRQLASDPYFDYRGDPDVSFLPQTSQYLIECKGNAFIERAYFQFYEEKLYIMTFILNKEKLDHYSLLHTLTGKYGEFSALNPEKITWEFAGLRLLLEKPLTIKYIDKKVFDVLKEAGQAEEQLRAQARQDFLEQF